MAVTPSTAATTALELNGQVVGVARRLQMPGYQVDTVVVAAGPGKAARLAANISISAMEASIDLTEPGPLLEWALSLPRGNALATDGAALVVGLKRKPQRRVEWSAGLITALKLPVLDATSKQAVSLGLTWQPATVSYVKPGDSVVALPASKRKPVVACNYRVSGLPFDGSFVTQVTLPTVTAKLAVEQTGQQRLPSRHYASVDLGELQLVFNARSQGDVLAWVQKVVADGRIADEDYLGIVVELLDASLKTVLGQHQPVWLRPAALRRRPDRQQHRSNTTLQLDLCGGPARPAARQSLSAGCRVARQACRLWPSPKRPAKAGLTART